MITTRNVFAVISLGPRKVNQSHQTSLTQLNAWVAEDETTETQTNILSLIIDINPIYLSVENG